MYNKEFSFIILTRNEEIHLPRLLTSILPLQAEVFVMDSGSSDQTLEICKDSHINTVFHTFENHPKQWHYALRAFEIRTPWVICLDADQVVSPQLQTLLSNFKSEDHEHINGIYFNRKNYFKGKWIRHGGYFPKYLLKMFRTTAGWSDLAENMDHRFIVSGKTTCWKEGYLIEENLKENEISFWISKHNTYSDLLATEEIERRQNIRKQSIKPSLFGTPDQKNAWLKRLWWHLPLHIRPFLYFIYRILLQRGLLDGKTGLIYHFLQGFWFRMIVDIKIEEKMSAYQDIPFQHKCQNPPAVRFTVCFLALFICFYGFHLGFIGLSSAGGFYSKTLDRHFNYIEAWRNFNIRTTAMILEYLEYKVTTTSSRLHVSGRAGFIMVYSCLGYGIMSFVSAFVLSYPKPLVSRIKFLLLCLSTIQTFNIFRLTMIALFDQTSFYFLPDHHVLYNTLLYILLSFFIFIWLDDPADKL